jgi:hypothetical protein
MKVLVFGSRHWTDKQYIRDVIGVQTYPSGTLFIHGDNGYRNGAMLFGRPDEEADQGADKLAGAVAQELGYSVQRFPALWRVRKRAAGPLRNRQMADERPDEALCFHENLAGSKGSKGMLELLRERGIPVAVFNGE